MLCVYRHSPAVPLYVHAMITVCSVIRGSVTCDPNLLKLPACSSCILCLHQALRQLVQCADGIGRAMTPYYKQFLQPMNTFLDRVKNIGDTIDYGQRKNDDVGEEVRLTLEIMERYGTEDAFKFIKFAIPPCKHTRHAFSE
mgnify:CR=1